MQFLRTSVLFQLLVVTVATTALALSMAGCVQQAELVDDSSGGGTSIDGGQTDSGSSSSSTAPGTPIPGDMNEDGVVSAADTKAYEAAFETAFGLAAGQTGYNAMLDMDGNSVIDFNDLLLFRDAAN